MYEPSHTFLPTKSLFDFYFWDFIIIFFVGKEKKKNYKKPFCPRRSFLEVNPLCPFTSPLDLHSSISIVWRNDMNDNKYIITKYFCLNKYSKIRDMFVNLYLPTKVIENETKDFCPLTNMDPVVQRLYFFT